MKSVSFDLEYSSRLQPASDDAIEKEIEETLEREEPSKQQLHALAQSLGDASVDVDGNQPWILPLVSTLLKGCRFGEADLVNHPLAVILIVSSTDTDPLHRFDELSQRVLQRPVFRNGSYSKSIPFFYFLIHTSEAASIAEGVFRTMKSTFNASQCKMLRINSLSKEEQRSVTPSSLSSVPSVLIAVFLCRQGTCLRLSDEDIRGMKETMHGMIMKNILPNLAKMITVFTQDVVNDRRGIANALFGWLRTSSSTNMLNANQDEEFVLYNRSTIEFKIRFIADIAFLVHVIPIRGHKE